MAYKTKSKTGIIPGIGKVKLNLELNITPNTLGGGDILAVASLYNDGNNTAVENQTIIFYLGKDEKHKEELDSQGRVSYSFNGLIKDNYIISAEVEGFPGIQVFINYDFQTPVSAKVRVPTKFKVTAKPEKETSEYEVLIELGDENGGIPNFPIVILDMDNPDKSKRKNREKTDYTGAFIYPVSTDRRRNIYITAVGTEHETDKIHLPGPRKEELLAPPPKPKAQTADLSGSIIDIAKNAHNAYKDFLNKKREGMDEKDIINSRPLSSCDYDLPFFRKWWFNFVVSLHYDNYRWKILFYFFCLFGISSILLSPFVIINPVYNNSQFSEKEKEFYKGIVDEKIISGEKYDMELSNFEFLRGIEILFLELFLIFGIILFIYTFFAFGDDFKRAFETARVKMWDKYGAELTSKGGVFSRMFLGQQHPQQAVYAAGTLPIQGSQMPTPGYTPITRGYYLFWEMFISMFSEFFSKIFFR